MEYKYYKEVTGELVRVHIEQDTGIISSAIIKKIVILTTLIS